MRLTLANTLTARRLTLLVLVLGLCSSLPLVSRAYLPTNTVTIVNNTSREIRHVYFSPTSQDDWGPDQLNSFVIAPGGTRQVGNSCSSGDIKVVAENQDGCFFYHVVSCGSDASWTIAGDAAPDCGN